MLFSVHRCTIGINSAQLISMAAFETKCLLTLRYMWLALISYGKFVSFLAGLGRKESVHGMLHVDLPKRLINQFSKAGAKSLLPEYIYAPIRCNSDAKHVKHSRACTVLPTE